MKPVDLSHYRQWRLSVSIEHWRPEELTKILEEALEEQEEIGEYVEELRAYGVRSEKKADDK